MTEAYGTRNWFAQAYSSMAGSSDPWGVSIRGCLQYRLDLYSQAIRKHVDLVSRNQSSTILDIGCAFGDFTSRMAEWQQHATIIGVDLSDVAVNQAKKRYPIIGFGEMELPHLAFQSGTFDLVTCLSVLCYPPSTARIDFIREIKRILAPGGYIFLEVPLGEPPYFTVPELEMLVSTEFMLVKLDTIHAGLCFVPEAKLFVFYGKLQRFIYRFAAKYKNHQVYSMLLNCGAKMIEVILTQKLWAHYSFALSDELKMTPTHAYVIAKKLN